MGSATTVEESNAIVCEQRLSVQRRLRDAFLAVFGPPAARTPHGLLILEHLEGVTNWNKVIREMDSTGQTDIYRTGIKEGRREVMQEIHLRIEWKEHSNVDPSSSRT